MTWLNDVVARLMIGATPIAAWFATRAMARRIAHFSRDQEELRARYAIGPDTPIRSYDEDTRSAVLAIARALPDARIATTSGSTGAPKELVYTKERLRSYKRDSISGAIRAYARYRVRRPGMFVLASLKTDDSFASLVLHGRGEMPPYLAGLVEPSRYLAHPALARVIDAHGANAARLWLMIVADPGMIYATNPSTLVAFFTELQEHWTRIRLFLKKPDPALDVIARRVGARGYRDRLALASSAEELPSVDQLMPSLTAFCTWDGGYVTAFLPALYRFLSPDRYVHLPMYSMSTETIETLTWFDDDGDVRFLPLAPGVLYEFLPEDAADVPEHLLPATSLEAGKVYAMVVSDPWGLERYQTDDLFLCKTLVRGLPDLRFLRRRGLAYSFTGEKLTGEQLTRAFGELRQSFREIAAGVELVCFPSQPTPDSVPFYRLILAPTTVSELRVSLDEIAGALDRLLIANNHELASKRASGRLGPIQAQIVPYDALAVALDRRTQSDDDVNKRAWESQFKLTPLMKRRWEDVQLQR